MSHHSPWKIQPYDFAFIALDVIAAGRVGWIPMSHAEENSFRGASGPECVRAEQPIAGPVFGAHGFHMARPVSYVEMESGVEQWTRRRRHKLNVHVLRRSWK